MLSGGVHIETGCFIGIVKNKSKYHYWQKQHSWLWIMIISNINNNSIYAGIPAKKNWKMNENEAIFTT